MNIETLSPESGLTIAKVTNVITPEQLSLLVMLAEGKIPTGFRQAEIDQAVQDIRAASIEAGKIVFNTQHMRARKEDRQWPWFDLREGEGRASGETGVYNGDKGQPSCFAEFVVSHGDGGEIKFDKLSDPIKLAPGEMLISSREPGYEMEITKVSSGVRFTLMTLML
jgi:hypothetical protein